MLPALTETPTERDMTDFDLNLRLTLPGAQNYRSKSDRQQKRDIPIMSFKNNIYSVAKKKQPKRVASSCIIQTF